MKTNLFVSIFIASAIICSCNSRSDNKTDKSSENFILQQPDGTLTLRLEKAVYYNNDDDPSGNTAEWNVTITKTGRYNVWLSSATRDTTDLNYTKDVKVNLQDNPLEASKEINRIIRNSDEVRHPYYQADSFMGSFFVQEPGEYYVQVISEKIMSEENRKEADNIRLMSVLLTPQTR